MLEFPEVQTMARQLQQAVAGKRVRAVRPPSKPHKFCWFTGDPGDYAGQLQGRRITEAVGFGIYAALRFDNGRELCFNDGVNVRLTDAAPKEYQLLVELEEGGALAFTVAMYGGILLHSGGLEDEYYRKSRGAPPPLSPEFPALFRRTLEQAKPTLSAKAFMATEQRFPGIGNGVLQDILFEARIHPKQKIGQLGEADREALLRCTIDVLGRMAAAGGRDTERDLYGSKGGYRTVMSKTGMQAGCPVCGGPITKQAYLGGSVYFCPHCQPLPQR